MLLQKHALVLFFILFVQIFSFAQMEVTSGSLPPYDPQTLIEDVLLGEGVEILSIQYDGPDRAVGYFNSATSDIGLEEGIVLTTGVAASEGANVGIVEPGSMEASANNLSTATDPDIELLAEGEDIFNLTKYTITFVPSSDRLSFRYVFASEEYPEFGCTPYNDFFGFFISGPGFSGVYENGGENIALIPGTNQAVSINNIHPQNPVNPSCTPVFTEFFNDNNGSGDFPVYDGYLDIFTAEAIVVPCETYTIKLVIADISDAQRDSGVFFEAKSFNSKGFQVSANSQALDGTLIEGCTEGEFNITIAEAETTDLTIDYQMVGDATNGVDYETISGTISIPAGQTSVSIPVVPIGDANIENVESIGLDILINDCTRDTFFLYLRDPELETPDLGDDVSVCSGASVDLDGTITASSVSGASFNSTSAPLLVFGPMGSNPPVPAYMDIEVSGFNPPQLREGLISQVCINLGHSAPEDFDIYLYAPGGQFMLLSSDNGAGGSNYTDACFSPTATNSIVNGSAPFTGTFAAEGNWETLWFGDSPVNGTWRLMAIDDETGFTGTIQNWSIEFNSTFEVNYSWSPTTDLTCSDCPTPTASPSTTTEYTLTVSDSYGCETSDDVTITVIDSYAAPVVNCTDVSTSSVTFTWDVIPNAEDYEVNVNNDGWFPLNNPPLSHTVDGLSTGEMVSIEVRATGPCPANGGTQTCQTIDCSGFSVMQDSEATSCNGEDDGTITLSAMSANSGITYTLGGDENTTGTFSGLTAGMYTILVSDDAGCSESVMVEVTEPDALTSNILLNNNIDCNDETGSATATGGGGDNSFTYTWSNGDMGATLTALTADEYFVTIIDGNMCQTIDSVDIISEGSLEATIASNVICAGTTDGEATVSVTVGTEPIEYQWDSNAANQMTDTATGLMPGEYFVTVTSADNCELVLSTTITTHPEMTLVSSSTDANCGSDDGTASVMVMGGTADFAYLWSDALGQTTDVATGLAAGEYFVTVTDANMCTAVSSAIVNTPSGMTLVSVDVTDVSCFGGTDGTVMLEATGGTAPLTYTFNGSTPQSTGDFDAIPAGEYTIQVIDDMGCSTSFPFTVNQPVEMETTPISISEIECDTPNGTATVSILGGDGPYSFAWSDMSTDSILIANAAGEYYVTVTDINNCMTSDTVIITTGEFLTVSTGSTMSCADDANGMAFVEILTGTSPFTFAWEGGSDNDTLYNVIPGDYMVTVSDANNCEVIETVTIGAFPEMTLSTSTTEAGCGGVADGTATVMIMGGTADFSYLWSDASGQTTDVATGLSAGEYFVTVTDASLCTSVISAVVTTPSSINLLSLVATDASCFGEENGTLMATADGGTAPLSYTVGMLTPQATGNFNDLAAGDYNLVVEDAMGCSSSFPFTIEAPEEIATTPINIQTIDCQNPMGSATVSVTGGNLPYSFAWSDMSMSTDSILMTNMAGEYYVTVTDGLNCTTLDTVQINEADVLSMDSGSTSTCNGETTGFAFVEILTGTAPFVYQWDTNAGDAVTDTVFNLAPGMYTVTVTDAGNCELIETITVGEYPAMVLNTSTTDADCNGAPDGTATVTVMGGTADFTYLWSDATGQTTTTATDLSAGLYTVTVTDANGCTMTADANVSTPSMLSIGDISATNVSCFDGIDGTATVTATGGTGGFTFAWSDATMQSTATATNLSPAEYTVTVSDEMGCLVTASIEVENAEEIILDFATVDVLCASDIDGSIDLTIASGGTPAFTYAWSNMETTEDLNNLSAGIYMVTVTDANMCTATGEATINTTAPIAVVPTTADATCYNYEDGSVSIEVAGGVEPYTYAWSTGEMTDSLSDIAAGTYELTVTDANNCGVFSTIEIGQPDVFSATVETEEPLCAGDETGVITITPIGGAPDFLYSLEGVIYTDNPIFENLPAQTYHLFVQDGNGCLFDSTDVVLTAPSALRVDAGEDVSAEIGERAFLEALVSGGTGAVDFSWETPEDISLSCEDCFAPFAIANESGNLIVTAIDENDCIATDDIFITALKNYNLFIPNVFSPDLDGINDIFMPYGKANTLIKSMQIFDRWGNVVYDAGDFFASEEIGWDGKVNGDFAETGVYVYSVEAIFVDGESVLFKGDVTVLR